MSEHANKIESPLSLFDKLAAGTEIKTLEDILASRNFPGIPKQTIGVVVHGNGVNGIKYGENGAFFIDRRAIIEAGYEVIT